MSKIPIAPKEVFTSKINDKETCLESLECNGHWIPNIFNLAGGRRFCSARALSSTGGVWCLPPDDALVPLLRRRRRLLSTKMKLSPLRMMYEERSVEFSSPCRCLIRSAVRSVWMFWYSASGGADVVTSRLVPLPSRFLREEWSPTRRQTFSMNPYFLSSHYIASTACHYTSSLQTNCTIIESHSQHVRHQSW